MLTIQYLQQIAVLFFAAAQRREHSSSSKQQAQRDLFVFYRYTHNAGMHAWPCEEEFRDVFVVDLRLTSA